MSVTNRSAVVGITDRDSRTSDSEQTTATATDSRARTGHLYELLVADELVAVDQFIAGVLGRAHETAARLGAYHEARAILHVAHLFADDLARTNLQFDRLRFIAAATAHSA